MGERDAFGREIGENPLEAMGWDAPATPPPARPPGRFTLPESTAFAQSPAPTRPPPAPAPAPSEGANFAPPPPAPPPAAAPRPRPTPDEPPLQLRTSAGRVTIQRPPTTPGATLGRPPRRRRRRGFGLGRLIFIVAICFALYYAAVAGVRHVGDAIKTATPGATPEAVPTAITPQAGATGGHSTSLYSRSALIAAMKKLPSGRVILLTIFPDHVSAQIVRGTHMHVVLVAEDGSVSDISTPVAPPLPSLRVSATAASRAAQSVARHAHQSLSHITQVSAARIGSHTQWTVFTDSGHQYTTDAAGRHPRTL